MENIIIESSKYLIIILFAIYTYQCFAVFKYKSTDNKDHIFAMQNFLMFAIHLMANVIIYLQSEEDGVILFYLEQVAFFGVIIVFYKIAYPKMSRLVVNNMCMLMAIGFIMNTRLSYDKAQKQFIIAVISMIVTSLIPLIIRKFKFLKQLTWIYAGIGIILLAIVAVLGRMSFGANISFTFYGITVQPSEFVKIIFVFFLASRFYESTKIKDIFITSVIAAVHVLILVASKDLGAALIFFIVYLFMLYVSTRKPLYLGAGLLGGGVAAVLAYKLFSHVRVRVLAWRDPWSVIDDEGYQITQSLFAIGTGGWFGMGLYQGSPTSIPVVEKDFIFAAICEEMGGIFGVCLIFVCLSCFLMFLNIAMQIRDRFYKLVALGLGTMYGFQIFLTVGGVIKFIPSTGVTLPLVSYGGSSLLSTLIIFAIIQGLYILRQDEGETNGKKSKKPSQRTGKDEPQSVKRSEKTEVKRRKA